MIQNKKNISNIKEAIVQTIAFFDIFDYSLTDFEIWKYLSVDCSYGLVREVLQSPDMTWAVKEKNGLYFAVGREELIKKRHERQTLSHEKYKIARQATRILRNICGVKMIAVCNNFSYREDSDIDLFIVVARERMWLSRFLTTIIMQIFKLRRHGDKVANRICLSFYVTEDSLDLSSVVYDDDPYFNYWLAWLTPIYDSNNYYKKFWQANNWLKSYLPNIFQVKTGDERIVKNNYFSIVNKKLNNRWFNSFLGTICEKLVKRMQLDKMAKNYSSVATADDTRVVISDKMLKFHEEDRRDEYKENMNNKVKRLLKIMQGVRQVDLPRQENNYARKQENKKTRQGELRSKRGCPGVKQRNRVYFLSKAIKWGMYLLMFLLPLQTRWIIKAGIINNGYSEYGTISLYVLDIVVLLLFCLIAYNAIFNKIFVSRKKIIDISKRYGTLLFLIAGLDLVVFVSVFFSDNKIISSFYYLRFLLGVGIFWLIINVQYNRLKLYYAFFAGVFLQSVLAIWQFLSQSTFTCKWLGISAHKAGEGMASVIEVTGGGRWLRAYGGLDHPNMLGGFLVLGLLMSIWINLAQRYKLNKNYSFLLINYVYIPVVIVALFFTFSRASWLGLAFGLIAMMIIAIIKRDLMIKKKILKTVLVSGIMCFVMYICFFSLIETRITNNTRLEKKSTSERIESFYLAGEIIRSEPVLGVGIGNYTNFIHKYIRVDMPSYAYQPVHNTFLLVASELGWGGSLFFINIFIFLLLLIFKKCLQADSVCYIFGIILSILIMMMFDHWWWSLHFGVVLFWVVLGMVFMELEGQVNSEKYFRNRASLDL